MPEKFNQPKQEQEDNLPQSLARIDAYEEKRLKERTAEDIEIFNINEDGLVVHGTKKAENLESIIKNGLGQVEDKRGQIHEVEVDFHVVGAKTYYNNIDSKRGRKNVEEIREKISRIESLLLSKDPRLENHEFMAEQKRDLDQLNSILRKTFHGYSVSSTGFSSEKTLFGNLKGEDNNHNLQFYLVSDVFKKFYPEVIDVILTGTSGKPQRSVFEQIAIPPLGQKPQNINEDNSPYYFERLTSDPDYNKHDKSKYQRHLGREIIFFPSEKTSLSIQYPETDNYGELLMKSILGYRTFNAIVIPEIYTSGRSDDIVLTQEEILKQIIEIQDKLLPKAEQIPCYSMDGKCIYNPLKNLPPNEQSSE